jgi:CDP-glucose 4,6-dehydratase
VHLSRNKALKFSERCSFWSGKRVLVTGHSGFKGKWLSRMLKHFGATVGGVSSYPIDFSTNGLESIKVESKGWTDWEMIGDLADPDPLVKAITGFSPSIIVHLAAQPIVSVGYLRPFETFRDNLLTSLNVLEFVRVRREVETVLIVTSDKVYENNNGPWAYRETDTLGGVDPYSCSKSMIELMCKSYYESFFRPQKKRLATARAGNVIGGGDFGSNRLVPDLIRAYLSKADMPVRLPEATRPWQYVLEPLNGYLTLVERMHTSAKLELSYNFGPLEANNASVETLLSEFTKYFPVNIVRDYASKSTGKEMHSLRLDTGKSSLDIGFHGYINLATAVERSSAIYTRILFDGLTVGTFDAEIKSYFADEF